MGRPAVVEILARSGVRVSELCDMRIGHLRIHDADGSRFRVPDAKTETGIREVQMSPDLVHAVKDHLERLRRVDAATGPDDYLIQNVRGGRVSRQRVGQIVADAAEGTTERMLAWVMSQVGHANSKMTMDVCAQLEQRVKREHGTSFDRLLRDARNVAAETTAASDEPELSANRHRPRNRPLRDPKKRTTGDTKKSP